MECPPSLDQVTTEDIVTELQKRMNFRGVVIWQPGYKGVPDTNWRWHAMHCLVQSVCSEILQAMTPADVVIECEPGQPATDEAPAAA